MDWVRFTRDEVDSDALPRVCMVCGKPATESVNKTFSYKPQWVEYLYFLGFFPGLIAERFCTKEMRVSCPVCPRHRNHWSNLVWVASVGWLLAVPFAFVGPEVSAALFPTAELPMAGVVAAGAGVGLLIWLVIVIRLAVTRVRVSEISSAGDEITFERVSDAFAKAGGVESEPTRSSWRAG